LKTDGLKRPDQGSDRTGERDVREIKRSLASERIP
jgi:hypothetical protein